jgi:capsular polysaccharide biosynthesis protein
MDKLNTHPENITSEDEIDLIALAKTAWSSRRTIITTTLIFMVLGVFIALLTPNQYSVTATLVPQASSGASKLGGLSSLAAMAGFNMDLGTTAELSPAIYPKIVQSVPFKRELLQTKINFKGKAKPISLYEYYTDEGNKSFNPIGLLKKYTIGLPGVIISAIKGKKEETVLVQDSQNEVIALSQDEYEILKSIEESVSLNADVKEGTLTLTSTMPEALASAELGQSALTMLQRYITMYKIEKAQEQLNFIQERFEAKKSEFEQAQMNLASFRDRNKNVSTAMAQTEGERLQSEYQIAFSVYNELAKQVETAKIQVKQDTPVLTIIEPITIPNEKSEPKRSMIVFIWVFLGGIVGIGWVFGKEYLKDVKKKWKEAD